MISKQGLPQLEILNPRDQEPHFSEAVWRGCYFEEFEDFWTEGSMKTKAWTSGLGLHSNFVGSIWQIRDLGEQADCTPIG